MRGIGGNIQAVIQIRNTSGKNEIGETVKTWTNAQTLRGWLDLATGRSTYNTYFTKIQESTHIFICDFVPLDKRISAENSRLLINNKAYDIMLMDNPMEMGGGSQWEFYLKYTGGQ